MAFKWLGSFIVDHSNHGDYIPIAFFIIPSSQDKSGIRESFVRQEQQVFIHNIWKD